MRVFIYEYVCGGGLAGRPLPESLAREGWAMLASIVEDFARVEGCEVVTTLDERFAGRSLAARWVERLDADTERKLIERLARDCDWTLVIAPEFDGILEERVRCVENARGRLLGPSAASISVVADKFACGRVLERSRVPAAVGRVVRLAEGLPCDVPLPAVLKPRDGAGSRGLFLIRDAGDVSRVLHAAAAEGLCDEALVQPFISGRAASVSFLIGPAGATPLLPSEQMLSDDGRFRYLGGRMPLRQGECQRAVALATTAVAAATGLNGFVGVDLVLDEREGLQIANCKLQIANCRPENSNDVGPLADDTSAPSTPNSALGTLYANGPPRSDVVIEINPRLTTSYVGLRRLARANLAEQMLRVAAGEEIEPIGWRPGTIRFSADGRVAYSEADPGNASR